MSDAIVERSSTIALTPDARFRGICGEGVVLNQTLAEVLIVNEVGLRVLELMGEDGSVAHILDRLEEELEIDAPTLERDVLAFMSELVGAGVLRPAEIGAATP